MAAGPRVALWIAKSTFSVKHSCAKKLVQERLPQVDSKMRGQRSRDQLHAWTQRLVRLADFVCLLVFDEGSCILICILEQSPYLIAGWGQTLCELKPAHRHTLRSPFQRTVLEQLNKLEYELLSYKVINVKFPESNTVVSWLFKKMSLFLEDAG